MTRLPSLRPTPGTPRVLVANEDADEAKRIIQALRDKQIPSIHTTTIDTVSQVMVTNLIDVVVASTAMQGVDAESITSSIKTVRPLCQVILVAGKSKVRTLVEMLESGVVDFFLRPISDAAPLVEAVSQAISRADRWRTSFVGPDPSIESRK